MSFQNSNGWQYSQSAASNFPPNNQLDVRPQDNRGSYQNESGHTFKDNHYKVYNKGGSSSQGNWPLDCGPSKTFPLPNEKAMNFYQESGFAGNNTRPSFQSGERTFSMKDAICHDGNGGCELPGPFQYQQIPFQHSTGSSNSSHVGNPIVDNKASHLPPLQRFPPPTNISTNIQHPSNRTANNVSQLFPGHVQSTPIIKEQYHASDLQRKANQVNMICEPRSQPYLCNKNQSKSNVKTNNFSQITAGNQQISTGSTQMELAQNKNIHFKSGNNSGTANILDNLRPNVYAPFMCNQLGPNVPLLPPNMGSASSPSLPLLPPSFLQLQNINRIANPVVRTQLPIVNPPLVMANNDSLASVDLKAEYKEIMVDIVEKWTKSRGSLAVSKFGGKSFLKIHQYKENLKVFVGLIDRLRQMNDSLAEHMQADKNVWNKLMKDITETKNDVLSMQLKLFHPDQVKYVTNLQKERKKKRDRIKRKKKASSERYFTSLSNRIKLNEEIDEWQQKEHTKIAMEKMVESLKNEAGESLVGVKRKQTEVVEFLKVLNLLKELRDVRKKTAIYKGFIGIGRSRS